MRVGQIVSIRQVAVLVLFAGLFASASASASDSHTSGPFQGPKANTSQHYASICLEG
jgi:hypothetical protein